MKDDQKRINTRRRNIWLPEEPPESIRITLRKDFLKFDRAKNIVLEEDEPETKATKKFGLAVLKVFK